MLLWAGKRYVGWSDVLNEIAMAPPTAELRPDDDNNEDDGGGGEEGEGGGGEHGQTDEEDMGMTYEELVSYIFYRSCYIPVVVIVVPRFSLTPQKTTAPHPPRPRDNTEGYER